jgi:hypothetical protein
MGCTVFAEGMGWFHQSSNGTGTAPGDVCLSPPPPPAGPVPVPYVNMLFASDLIKGSKSVKADGSPTALETSSEVAMSTGNEPATPGLGAGVVTHRIKGKGAFMLWSFTVKVEGKGVCRHGDPMGQNEASSPLNGINAAAQTRFRKALGSNLGKKCPPYDRDTHAPAITAEQDRHVYGKKCWECVAEVKETGKGTTPGGKWLRPEEYATEGGGKFASRDTKAMTPDHQPPMSRAWKEGGCHMKPLPPKSPTGFQKYFAKKSSVKPHCKRHSDSQPSRNRRRASSVLGKM